MAKSSQSPYPILSQIAHPQGVSGILEPVQAPGVVDISPIAAHIIVDIAYLFDVQAVRGGIAYERDYLRPDLIEGFYVQTNLDIRLDLVCPSLRLS